MGNSIFLEPPGQPPVMFVSDLASYAIHFSRSSWVTAYDVEPLETIRTKGLKLEWSLYPNCVRLFAEGRLQTVRMTYPLKNGTTRERTVVKITPRED